MFVEALLPIGSAFDNLTRQDKVIDALNKNNDLSEQRAETAKLNAENRKRELDIIENNLRQSQINRSYGGVHLQMQPVRNPETEE